jgi:hypothetical protein
MAGVIKREPDKLDRTRQQHSTGQSKHQDVLITANELYPYEPSNGIGFNVKRLSKRV